MRVILKEIDVDAAKKDDSNHSQRGLKHFRGSLATRVENTNRRKVDLREKDVAEHVRIFAIMYESNQHL